DHPYLVALLYIHRRKVEPRIADRLIAGGNGVLGEEIVFPDFLFRDIIFRIEPFYLTSELCLELRCIKLCQGACTTFSRNNIFPERIDGISQWCNGSQARNNNSFHFFLLLWR